MDLWGSATQHYVELAPTHSFPSSLSHTFYCSLFLVSHWLYSLISCPSLGFPLPLPLHISRILSGLVKGALIERNINLQVTNSSRGCRVGARSVRCELLRSKNQDLQGSCAPRNSPLALLRNPPNLSGWTTTHGRDAPGVSEVCTEGEQSPGSAAWRTWAGRVSAVFQKICFTDKPLLDLLLILSTQYFNFLPLPQNLSNAAGKDIWDTACKIKIEIYILS